MYEYKAKVLSVYDGDTVTLDIDLGCHVHKEEKVRLNRINTPEVRGRERPEGLVSRDALRELILGKEVIIKTTKDKTGKYGRLIADIIFDGIDVNDWLVESGYAEFRDY